MYIQSNLVKSKASSYGAFDLSKFVNERSLTAKNLIYTDFIKLQLVPSYLPNHSQNKINVE